MSASAVITAAVIGSAIAFSHIGINDGLSQNTVLAICQDKEGYIWFGTANGVNRYDGYELRTFHSDGNDGTTLLDDLVNDMYLDGGGHVWVCSAKGVSSYDPQTERFTRYPLPGNESALTATRIAEDRMLVASSTRTLLLNTGTGGWTSSGIPAKIGKSTALKSIGDKVYIGTKDARICECRFEGDSLIIDREASIGREANDIVPDRKGKLWIATEGYGLLHMDLSDGSMERFDHSHGHLPSDYVRSVEYDMNGNLWIGTAYDLVILNEVNGCFRNVRSDYFDKNSLSHTSIKDICMDSQGGMWLGTYFGGVNYYHPGHIRFNSIRRSPNGSPLNDNIVSCIMEDADGTLWIGTNRMGVIHYDPMNGKKGNYFLSDVSGLESNDIKCLFRDPDGIHIYVGSHGSGLNVIDKVHKKISHIKGAGNIYAVEEASEGKLWVGALGSLYLYDKSKGGMAKVKTPLNGKNLHILCLMKDSSGCLWLGTKEGVRVLDTGADMSVNDVTSPELLRIYQTYSIHESQDRYVWIGSIDGLYRYDKLTGKLNTYTTDDGLPDNAVRAIGEDNYGRLWLSTDNGLCCFNPSERICRNYTEKDGLPSRQFLQSSYCRGGDGKMYFGSVEGIAWFMPETVPTNSFSPVPVFTDLLVFNKRIHPGDGSGILERPVGMTKRISLKHFQKSFTIRFATLNFIAGQHNTYSWKLEGYDKDWITGTEHAATYSNLRKGTYRLKVRSANNDGIWSDGSAEIEIRIRPVWWQSTFFEILFLILVLSGVGAGVTQMLKRQKERSSQDLQKMQEAHEKELEEIKAAGFASDKAKLSTADKDYLIRVIDIIEENISNSDFTVEKLAEEMNMSRMNLHLKLKEITGRSALELIRKIRFEKALSLLDEGRLTISQVADKTGFGSSSWFTTSFKKYMGETPSEYLSRRK